MSTANTTVAEQLARRFHETYERLAPSFGYKTREASAKPWAEVPDDNKRLMIAVAAELIESGAAAPVGTEAALSLMLRAMARRSARLKRQRNVWRRIQRDVVEVCGAEPGTPVPVAARALRSRVAALEARLAQAEQQRDEIVAEMSATRGALLGHLDMEWSSVPTAELVDEAFEGAVILPDDCARIIESVIKTAHDGIFPGFDHTPMTSLAARLVYGKIESWRGVAAQALNSNEPGPSEDDPGRIATTLGSQASRVAGVATQPVQPREHDFATKITRHSVAAMEASLTEEDR